MEYEIVSEIKEVNKNEAFMVIDDIDMVGVIELTKIKGFKLGKDVGMISYNEYPLKRVVANGITVISTDFKKMGNKVASYIINSPKFEKEVITTDLILRNSL